MIIDIGWVSGVALPHGDPSCRCVMFLAHFVGGEGGFRELRVIADLVNGYKTTFHVAALGIEHSVVIAG